MNIAKDCVVKLDYSVNDTEKNLLDSGAEPLIYLHGGYDDIFKKLENELEGKKVGDSIRVQMTPQESFGKYDDSLIVIEERHEFDDDIFVGEQFQEIIDEENGQESEISYTITKITDDAVTLDGNHPLAGIDVIFEATVLEVRKATTKEIKQKHAR